MYKLYRQYLAAPYEEARRPSKSGIPKGDGNTPGIADQLEQQLPRYGLASIAEFASYISRFEQAFEDGATRITLDILAKYAGKLYKESQRYQDPGVVKDLHGKLGGFRTQYQDFDKNAKIWNDYAAQHNQDAKQEGLPGNGGIHAGPPTPEQAQAGDKAKAAKASAEASIKDLSKDYPIFAEDDLPVDKRLDKVKLAQAGETQLAGVLHAHIADRTSVVVEARGQLEGKHELIYKMDNLMPAFYAKMDIQTGSIHDQIIKDKMHDEAIAKLVGGILLAIVAVALTVVSLGTATPAIIAAGASIGAAGLSTYMAYDEYKQYTSEHAIAEAGFADDPSVVWLVLAIVGAGVDMAAATKAVRALAPAAKALEAGGEVTDFTKAVEALQKSKQLDEKIAAAADKVGRGPIVNVTPHPSDPAIKRFEYSFWKQDVKGNLVAPLDRKAATYLKTTIKDLAGDTAKWLASAVEAAEDAIRKMLFPKGDASFSGAAKNGLKWSDGIVAARFKRSSWTSKRAVG